MEESPSDIMLGLLKELGHIKELDRYYEAGSRTEVDVAEFETRQHRRKTICDEIKALGARPA